MAFNSLDMMMSQMSTMVMMGNTSKITSVIWAFMVMFFVKQAATWVPHVANWAKGLFETHVAKKYSHIIPMHPTDTRTASIIYNRSYKTESSQSDVEREEHRITDAILNYAAKRDSAKFLRSSGRYYMAHTDEVKLEDGVFFKQMDASLGKEETLEKITIEVYSYTLTLTYLRRRIQKLYDDYMSDMRNELGERLYYFEDLPITLPKDTNGNIRYEVAPKVLTYRFTPFYTSKNLANVYGDAMRVVRKRVRFFMENREWYDRNGIPYTLGFLLYGQPGCGKTSLIKAIANECDRHVFSVKMGVNTTRDQMTNLFFSEDVHVNQRGENRTLSIPMKKRLLVFEDIDTMGDVVGKREGIDDEGNIIEPASKTSNPRDAGIGMSSDGFSTMMPTMGGGGGMPGNMYTALPITGGDPMANAHPSEGGSSMEKLDLGTMLNLMDGVLETPGRILIMTTNKSSALDPALIRPGRIDMIVHFKKCSRSEINEIYEGITGDAIETSLLSKLPDNRFSPAKITQKIFEYHDDPVKGIRELISEI